MDGIDDFVVSDHAFDEVEEVKAQLRAAKLRPEGVKPGDEIFDHTSSPWSTDTSWLSTNRDNAKPRDGTSPN